MKLLLSSTPASRRSEQAFTLVEIVLSLAIIAVALVAIIGVLPIGLNVQSDNQEESVIGADASIWMEFLTKGAQGGQYFEPDASGHIFYINEVRVDQTIRKRTAGIPLLLDDPIQSSQTKFFTNFTSASNLVGLLSLPKFPANQAFIPDDQFYTNWNVYADVRALNGNMADLAADMDFAFKYRMTPELVPLQGALPFDLVNTNTGEALPNLDQNLYELRLRFQWPLVPGKDGDYRAQTSFKKSLTFRTLISGQPTNALSVNNDLLSFMTPHFYTGIAVTNSASNP